MAWNRIVTLKIATAFVVLLAFAHLGVSEASKAQCGFPGTPAFGYVKPDEVIYSEGDVVSYSCRVGYILIGSSFRRCKDDGSWTDVVPICDDSMTTLGYASSTAAVPGHPAELAIDRDKDTCTYLMPKNYRWWRIDLGKDHKVLSVAVSVASVDKIAKFTVFVIKIQNMSASYKRCASFSGKFGTPTIVLNCAEGKGIEGQRVHIEDHLQEEGIFEVCEVEVQVEKDTGYICGRPNSNPNSKTFDVEDDRVEYGCATGYELSGREVRLCQNNGQWSGEAPVCNAIICEPLQPLEKGELKLSVLNGDVPLEGTVVNYDCNKGYKLIGDYNRICLRDGSWSGKHPKCEAVRCVVPDGSDSGGYYVLVNASTRMGSFAYLRCTKKKRIGENPFIVCTETGEWTDSQSRCQLPMKTTAVIAGPRIAKKEAIIFGMVVAGIMMTIVLVSLYVVTQRRRRARKPALPCRQLEAPEAPPRPPPRTKGVLASSFLQCVTGDSDRTSAYGGDEKDDENLLKTRSLPLKNSWKAEKALNRASSLEEPHHTGSDEDREKTRSISPRNAAESDLDIEDVTGYENSAAQPDQTSEEIETNVEDDREEKTGSATPTREYAAVDYEKKRQSRLLKEQSSEDADVSRQDTPTTPEDENSSPPRIPPKEGISSSESKPDDIKHRSISPETTKESPKIPAKQANENTGRTRRTRTTDDSGQVDTAAKNPKRTRAKVEEPAEEEEKPTIRGGRRTRLRE